MSQEERGWLEWLKRVEDGVITQREAAEKMGVSTRWVRKLLNRKRKQGDALVVRGLRGRPSSRKLPTLKCIRSSGPIKWASHRNGSRHLAV